MSLHKQANTSKMTHSSWKNIENLRLSANDLADRLYNSFNEYNETRAQDSQLMEHLEFSSEYTDFLRPSMSLVLKTALLGLERRGKQ